MVTIVDYQKRKNMKDEEFNVLILQGDIELSISKDTGKPYFTARKTSVPCTFDETIAKALIGKILSGGIQKQECEEYEFIIPGTKKKLKLNYSYAYSAEPVGMAEVVMG
jgi:hypothetical protein